jgi:hypothetical protein
MIKHNEFNAIDIIPVNSSAFCIRVPKVKFKSLQARTAQSVYYNFVYPEDYDPNLEITEQRDVFVVPYIEKYYHNFLELIPKILFLKTINPNFRLIVVANKESELNLKTGIFYGWEKQKDDNNHNLSNIKEFLDMSEIRYICTHSKSDFFENMVAQSAYIFFDFKKNIGRKRPSFYPKNYDFPNSYPFHATTAQTTESLMPYLDILHGIINEKISGDRSIYVSRKNFPERRLDNEESLEQFMLDSGYEIHHFETMSIVDQLKLVKECKRIVILNGSSAVNCMFANPGTEVFVFNNGADIVGLYEKACEEYNIQYNFIEMPDNNAEWIVKYLKDNNLDKPL